MDTWGENVEKNADAITECMSKTKLLLILLLVCVMFCLAACSSRENNDDIQKAENNSSNDEQLTSPETETETKNETDTKTESYAYKLTTDDKHCENQNFQGVKTAAYTEDGFYAYNYNDDMNHIYFIDKKSRRAEVLCYVPGCSHDMNSCNAKYIDFKGLYVSGSHLYVISSDSDGYDGKNLYLYRMNLDGSEKSVAAKLFAFEEEDLSFSLEFIIHRGYGYMVINWLDTEPSSEREQILYRISLEDGSKEELYKIEGYCPDMRIANTDGKYIYLTNTVYSDIQGTDVEMSVAEYDTESGAIQEITVPKGSMFRACYDEKMYYIDRQTETDKYSVKTEKKLDIYRSDIDGSSRKLIYSMPKEDIENKIDVSLVNMDGDYIYIFYNEINNGYRYLRIITEDGKSVCDYKLNMTDKADKDCIWSDKENLLIYDFGTNEYAIYNIKKGREVMVR